MKKVSNEQIANHLQAVAYLFAKNKDQWRSRAYSQVAGWVRSRLYKLPLKNGKVVEKIPGAGEAINTTIEEFAKSGNSSKMKKLAKLFPKEVLERFEVKTVKLRVSKVLSALREEGIEWGFAGSTRRGLRHVRDCDVIVVLKDEKKEKERIRQILAASYLKPDVRDGEKKWGITVPVKSAGRSFTLDLNFCTEENKGAYYLYFTGPKAFNISMRGLAKKKGMLLNEKGLFKGKKCVASETEEEIFEALGLEYMSPEEREGGL